jgi:FkbM family methyltransferase
MSLDIIKKIAKELEIVALDIGARGGPDTSLRPIKDLVSYIIFEPDAEEFARLQKSGSMGWRRIHPICAAIGSGDIGTLNLYRNRECSSLLEADISLANRFSREEYYILDNSVSVSVGSLDKTLENNQVRNVSYLKIDIQGAEIDALKTASDLLSNQLLLLRTEVSFLPIYKNQPCFSEVEQYLREFGFEFLRFVELHHWRRGSRVKYPSVDFTRKIASTGQLIHGDALFFRPPERLTQCYDSGEQLVKLALLAYAYGDIDLSVDCLMQTQASEVLVDLGLPYKSVIKWMCRSDLRRRRKEYVMNLLRNSKSLQLFYPLP